MELGLFKDFNKAVPFLSRRIFTPPSWSPRFGANYQFGINGTQHALRAVGGALSEHPLHHPAPAGARETAGFPWAIDSISGTEIRQAGAAWEAQWNAKTFTVLRLNALRLSTPTFFI